MFYFYIILSVVLIPFSNIFFDVLKQSYSWWLVPVLLIAYFFVLVGLHMLIMVIVVSFVNVKKPAEKASGFYRGFVNITIPMLFKLGRIKIRTNGIDKVPEDGRFLLVCNHQHDFDPIVMLSVLPQSGLGFIAKKDIYEKRPLASKIMHKLYCLPIDRENNREAAKTIIAAINLLKEDKASIGLFPEGYASKSGELLPLRNGAFKIALKAKVPIVVAVIDNTKGIESCLKHTSTNITFNILDTIYPSQFESMTTSDIGSLVYNKINSALTEIRHKK